MRFPLRLNLSLAKYVISQRIRGQEKFPLVLMLEPLHLCNAACEGCGRIVEYRQSLADIMSLADCFRAVEECGAPLVSISGGEPLIYPHIKELITGIIKKGKHIYLCTNGLVLARFLAEIKPHPRLTINLHLDGLGERHDRIVGKAGTFKTAIQALVEAKKQGFRVSTNTTVYRDTDMQEVEALFAYLENLGIDGMIISPAFSYEALRDREIFPQRYQIRKKFENSLKLGKRFKILNSPLYLRFLKGEVQLECTPWGNPTRNPQGWKAPCYLITDAHYESFRELMDKTKWQNYGPGRDKRCANCLVHCGFEPTAVRESMRNLKLAWEAFKWNWR